MVTAFFFWVKIMVTAIGLSKVCFLRYVLSVKNIDNLYTSADTFFNFDYMLLHLAILGSWWKLQYGYSSCETGTSLYCNWPCG